MFLSPYRTRFSQFFDWYADRLDSLLRVNGTVVNGIGLVGMENLSTRFNYLRALSQFYGAAVLSDLPALAPDVHAVIHQATEHWSVTGEACLIRTPTGIRTVRPDYVFPVFNTFDAEQIEKFLFVYPMLDRQETFNWDNEVTAATRAMVIEYDVATQEARQAIRGYIPGQVEDFPKGERVDIGEVMWIRCSEPPYLAVESLVRELIVRMNMIQLALNTTSYPLMQLDRDALNDGAFRTRSLGLQDFQRVLNNPLGLTVVPPFQGDAETKYIERSGTGLQESLEYARLLLGQLGILSGVPDYVFGIQLGRPNNETERVLFAGQARVNAFRRDLETALGRIGVTVKFGTEPFVTRQERLANIVSQLDAGIITIAEAREALGWDPSVTPDPRTPANGN